MNLFQILFITGVVLVFLNIKLTCPPSIVKYRYLPRIINENMADSAFASQSILKTYTNGNHNWVVFNDDASEVVNTAYNLENNKNI